MIWRTVNLWRNNFSNKSIKIFIKNLLNKFLRKYLLVFKELFCENWPTSPVWKQVTSGMLHWYFSFFDTVKSFTQNLTSYLSVSKCWNLLTTKFYCNVDLIKSQNCHVKITCVVQEEAELLKYCQHCRF